jgi:hypothetical protein
MQDVQLYINEEKSLSGTITYSTSYNISDNTKNFYENDWVVGAVITNIASGETANIVSIYSQVTIVIDKLASTFGYGSYSISRKDPKRLDLFKDETISLTQTIKNIKDISKIQTDFSQKFTVPASKNNNKIFKHYYNSFVSDGFDARMLKNSTIKLNGVDFKQGKMRLLGVKMKDNKPYAYNVGFVGNTVSLKDMFSDDELTDLPYLDVFNHNYTYTNIKTYMQSGFHLGTPNLTFPDMIYPFISSKSRYYLDTGQTSSGHDEIEGVRNIYNHQPSSINEHNDYHSILYTDLKPAILVKHILTAIEQKYGFTFSNDFFDPQTSIETRPQFDQLYMWCNRKAGSLDDLIDEESADIKFEDLTLDIGSELRQNSNTSFTIFDNLLAQVSLTYEGTINTSGGGIYDFLMYDYDTEEVYLEQKNLTGSYNFSKQFATNTSKVLKPTIKITTKAGITNFSLSNGELEVREVLKVYPYTVSYFTANYSKSSVNLSSGVDFRRKLLPKMKVLDFMKGLFNMFNLVAYFEGTELVVKTLDDYYLTSNHNEYVIDKYVDSSSSQVNRSDIYSEINYEFEKPKTIFAIKSNESTNDEYGNERFKSEGDNAFDGGKYDVKVKFGHMLYENIIDQDTEDFSNVLWGYSVDKDENPALEAPTLFFGKRSGYYGNLTNKYYVTNKPVGITGSYTNDIISYLYRPSNTYFTLSNNKHSINFGEEYDSLTNQSEPDGLFKIYHESFIRNIYAQNARIVKISAHLPLRVLLKYKLNDRFIMGGKKYLINSSKTNLQTGKTDLELITDNYIEE